MGRWGQRERVVGQEGVRVKRGEEEGRNIGGEGKRDWT